MFRFVGLLVAVTVSLTAVADAFVSPAVVGASAVGKACSCSPSTTTTSTSIFMSDDFVQGSPSGTQERIQALVDNHPVLLFMKGSRLFPQCGFSNTAVQILESFKIDFHTVDVLADEAIRSGVKEFSQWPTIPQLYVTGEFVGGKRTINNCNVGNVTLCGFQTKSIPFCTDNYKLSGSDIMIELYQSGELGEMIEKAKADMV